MLKCCDCGWIGHSHQLNKVNNFPEEEDELIRFTYKGYGEYLDSLNGKTPLNGLYYCVGKKSDEEGYAWRGFTSESWENVKNMTNEEIYEKYDTCKLALEEYK